MNCDDQCRRNYCENVTFNWLVAIAAVALSGICIAAWTLTQ